MRHFGPPDPALESESAIDQPRALIADDEAHLADYLQAQLAGAWPELRVLARAANGVDALRLVDELAPDVLFLDIQMPGLSGLELAARLAAAPRAPHIVFVTAYSQHAVAAFEHAAVDYLLKPVSTERLRKAVHKLKMALDEAQLTPPADALRSLLQQLATPAPAPVSRLEWIRAAQGEQTRLIAIGEVIYFQSNDKHTSVFLQDEQCEVRTPLRELREQLDEASFWQIHRGIIVAAAHVAGTQTDMRGRLVLRLKGRPELLTVSRNYVERFRQM